MVVGSWLEEPVVMAVSALALAVRVLKKGSGDLAVEGGGEELRRCVFWGQEWLGVFCQVGLCG